MNLSSGPFLDIEHLPVKIKQMEEQNHDRYNLDVLEREIILNCLKEFGTTVQDKEKAAQALGIGIATLYRKLARYERESS